jgi:hypothetical protein
MKAIALSRREALQAAGLAALPAFAADAPAVRRKQVLDYLRQHSRPDGGFAWTGEEASHLTPTHAAVGCYRLLGEAVPDTAKVAAFVRTGHPFRLKKLERDLRCFEFQQIQSLLWLGQDASAFKEQVRGWTRPMVYARQYERDGNPVFRNELTAFTCREMLGLPVDDLAKDFVPYLEARRRDNGSFNLTPASVGGDGHVMNTLWGLQALRSFGRTGEKKAELVEWLRGCQLPGGGFTYQPKPEFAGTDDVAYTRAAVLALAILGSAPADRDACVRSLWSLLNTDGGFGNRRGAPSNPVATYYALDALAALRALDSPPAEKPVAIRIEPLPSGLKVYTIQIESHGQGSPAEAVDLARSLRIHLWGAKNAKPVWLARAQTIADREKVPVRFFVANEEYGTWVKVPGLGTYSHTSDIFAPAGAEIGQSLANTGVVTWPEFRDRRLAPLEKGGGRVFWQFGENEELTRVFLDDSLARGGFAAISTFHFGNPDFTNSSPFLMQYRGRVPFVALQDAHGPEAWWFADMTTGFRTLFLATEPTWDGWLNALKQNWVVSVRRDAVSQEKLWLHAGRDDVARFVREHDKEWRWWDNPDIRRPLVSVMALTPADEFEAGRPEKGIAIRVRCAWENTTQGQPKRPLVELVKLVVDGAEVRPTMVTPKRLKGKGIADHYARFHLAEPKPGKHTVTATVRELSTGSESSRITEFTV